MTERYEQFERLRALRDNGTLTSEEYESEKRRVIHSVQAVSTGKADAVQQPTTTNWLRAALTSEMSKSVVLGAMLGALIAGPIPFFDFPTGAAFGAAIGAWRKM